MSARNFVDYYAVLGIEFTDDTSQISKAYRRRALKCHPDKNPNNQAAAEEFLLLSQAYEVLSDEKKKNAFDAIIKAKIVHAQRNKAMDDKRRKLKEQLEQNEQMAFTVQNNVQSERDAKKIYEDAIKRLRAESSLLIMKQKEKQTKSETNLIYPTGVNNDCHDKSWNVKLTWKCNCNTKNGNECSINEKLLKRICNHASNILISKNKSMAIIEFLNEKNAFDCYSNSKKCVENVLPDHLVTVTSLQDFTSVSATSAPTLRPNPQASSLDELEDMILSKFTSSTSK